MSSTFLNQCFGLDVDRDEDRRSIVYVGDSPNDAPMFGFFPYSVGVANIMNFVGRLDAEPTYVTDASDGAGFVEVAQLLLDGRN